MEGLGRDEIGQYNRLLCGSDFSLRLRDKDPRTYFEFGIEDFGIPVDVGRSGENLGLVTLAVLVLDLRRQRYLAKADGYLLEGLRLE